MPETLQGSGEATLVVPAGGALFRVGNDLMVPFTRAALDEAQISSGKDQVLEETTTVEVALAVDSDTPVTASLWYRAWDPELERVGYEGSWSPPREGDCAEGEALTLGRDDLIWLCTKENAKGGIAVEEGCPRGPWLLVETDAPAVVEVSAEARATVVWNRRTIDADPTPRPFTLTLAPETEDPWTW